MATAASLVLSLAVAVASPLSSGASCNDPYSSHQFISPNGSNYFWAFVSTASSCTSVTCSYVEATQGGKGSISADGGPIVFDDTQQHVLEWLGSKEKDADCSTKTQTNQGCWIQTGWELGFSSSCGGQIHTTVPEVYVEVYDDTTPLSSTCLLTTFGGAATAAYDARYVSDVGNLHRYHVYYQDPASSTIQDLAWGDFIDFSTSESAESEVYAGPDGSLCPVLGQTINQKWNLHGYGTSPGTFASNMSLYQNGSWHDWTTAVVPQIQYFPQSSTTPAPPYLLQPTSNFTTTFTQWKAGGPNG